MTITTKSTINYMESLILHLVSIISYLYFTHNRLLKVYFYTHLNRFHSFHIKCIQIDLNYSTNYCGYNKQKAFIIKDKFEVRNSFPHHRLIYFGSDQIEIRRPVTHCQIMVKDHLWTSVNNLCYMILDIKLHHEETIVDIHKLKVTRLFPNPS